MCQSASSRRSRIKTEVLWELVIGLIVVRAPVPEEVGLRRQQEPDYH